jgi:diguanylate cyclase (GGDEF)-like protein/PAS domain S-box-containing protein
VDPRRWWLLAGVLPVAVACALASSDPALRPLGDLAVIATGLSASAVLLTVARRADTRLGWRLLAAAPVFPVLGAVLAAIMSPADPLQLVVLRWAPTVPGYVLAIAGLLTLVDAARLRAGGLRLVVELALFVTASLVVVQLLVVGPQPGWGRLDPAEHVILGAAVVVTSATMAAALTLLGVIEAHRQRMALVLLMGAVALTAGRGLGTSALLSGADSVVDTSRWLIAAGLWLLCAAALMEAPADAGVPAAGRSAELGQLLPHVAMLVAVAALGAVAVSGSTPGKVAVVGVVLSVALAAVHRGVTARDERRMAGLLRQSEAHFRSLVRSSGDAVIILDDALRITWASAALERFLGSAAAELVGRPLFEAIHAEDAPSVAATLPGAVPPGAAPAQGAGPTGLLLLRLRDADGVWHYLEASVSDLRRDPDVGAVVLNCRDMTDRHARELALQSVAYTDPATGLPNRAGFQQSLGTLLSASGRRPATVVMIALDGVEEAREHAGREVFSAVVAALGRRLRDTVRSEDVVARLGGGAFAILADGAGSEVDQLAARCHTAVERPFPTTAGLIDLTAEVGLAELEPGLDVETLLGRADLAVQAAAASGPGSTARYGPELGAAAARRERLRVDLSGACSRDEFFLLLQPVVYLEEQRVTGVEATVRWRHPEYGEVLPAEFVPIAASAGLIAELQRWVFQAAMTATASLPGAGTPLRVGINVPPAYLRTGLLVSDVETALRTSGLGAERLILEIGEDAVLADGERVGLDLATLRLMGVHVALDSFGTGESALAHLTQLPIDVLKLDRSLISRLDRDPRSRAFCEAIVGIGRALGLDVVAQGVETSAQLAALEGFGCGFAQGFLIARPMPVSALAEMLAEDWGALWPRLVGSR